jgi:hypothetical protein
LLIVAVVVLATWVPDHLTQLWVNGERSSSSSSSSSSSHAYCHPAVPTCHVLCWLWCAGAAFLGSELLTVGADGNICVWSRSTVDDSSIASAQHTVVQPWSPTKAVAAAAETDVVPMQLQLQQHQQQRQFEDSGAFASLRSWLEPRRVFGTAAVAVAAGVPVLQQQPVLVDEGATWVLDA